MKGETNLRRFLVAVTLVAVGMLLAFSPGLRLGAVVQAARTSPVSSIPASTDSQREQQLALRRLLFLVHSLELESRLGNPSDDRGGDCEYRGVAALKATASPAEFRPAPWLRQPATKSLRTAYTLPSLIFAFDVWLTASFADSTDIVWRCLEAKAPIDLRAGAPSLLPRGGIH